MSIQIALIDDEAAILRVVADVFERIAPCLILRGFERGSAFLAALDGGYAPDIVLLDYKLADMKASEILRRLEPMQAQGASVYIFTGDEGAVEEEERHRADGIIAKAEDIAGLAARVLDLEEQREIKAGTGINALGALHERIEVLRCALREGKPWPPKTT